MIDVRRYAFGAVVLAAMLAGCGGTQPPLGALGAPTQTTANRTRPPSIMYEVLHSFKGASGDGAFPWAGLINVEGTLYGTTTRGGADDLGAVFAMTPSGKETLLYSFGGSGVSEYPQSNFINVNGTLYSTADGGGSRGDGTVFSMTPSGKETVLYSFYGGGGDGAHPYAGLTNISRRFYGTTAQGGANCPGSGCGTVFSVTPSGKETVLHSFGGSGDGEYPYAGLLNVKGTLYGTSERGGEYCGTTGCGTVFSITQSGKETVLHSFEGDPDGAAPFAGLIDVKGTLYGTTDGGGANGYGTVFSITPSGKETVLYSFRGGSGDGASPQAGLINVNGTLYGTTYAGGVRCSSRKFGTHGCGTVFSITPSGAETVLYTFKARSEKDGAHPVASLLNVSGRLYGTTSTGGADGLGTVFALAP